jgi:hypothetical protein
MKPSAHWAGSSEIIVARIIAAIDSTLCGSVRTVESIRSVLSGSDRVRGLAGATAGPLLSQGLRYGVAGLSGCEPYGRAFGGRDWGRGFFPDASTT